MATIADQLQAQVQARDNMGRPVAADGYPISGLARPEEVAIAWGVSRSLVYQMITSGKIQSKRFGRARRIPWSAVRELISCDTPDDSSAETH